METGLFELHFLMYTKNVLVCVSQAALLLHQDKDISYSGANYLIHKPFNTYLFHPSN